MSEGYYPTLGEVKTLTEWEKEYGVKIIDPDGFDRTDPNLYTRIFTRSEFEHGIIRCTLRDANKLIARRLWSLSE